MFNDHLSNEMAKEYIERREKEVETYSLHTRLGYGGNGAALWVFVLIVVIAVVALALLF
jgi:hypothetical protein